MVLWGTTSCCSFDDTSIGLADKVAMYYGWLVAGPEKAATSVVLLSKIDNRK